MSDDWFARRFAPLENAAWIGTGGVVLVGIGLFWSDNDVATTCWVIGILGLLPLMFHLFMIPVWHWRERYRGAHPDLWGALLVIETSSWSKLIYWFRHVLPDWRGRGRYRRPVDQAV
ncbi:MAG TPA: hypothetical protein VFI39_05790 [Gemmatimonadales bacterium]|nr:hypothetical protein [Gemmatimonadales bacterium]